MPIILLDFLLWIHLVTRLKEFKNPLLFFIRLANLRLGPAGLYSMKFRIQRVGGLY